MPVCLCLFSGIPASGKTSTAQRIISSLTSMKVHHLNYDDFVQPEVAYILFRRKMLEKIENFIRQYNLESDRIVLIVDDNMNYRSMRKEVYNMAKRFQIGYFQVFFKISLELAQERNHYRPDPLPDETLLSLFSKMEDPSQDLGIDTVTINVDSDEMLHLHHFGQKVDFHFKNREHLPEKSNEVKEKVEQSDLHRIDLILRKKISRTVREASDRETMKTLAEDLNNRRKIILKNFRETGEIPESIDEVRNLLASSQEMFHKNIH
ncbi:hypothetical protein DMENIID0001_079820 [Sergentomyia squamirostris]